MERLLFMLSTKTQSKPRWDDDFADRLHHRYTVGILIIFAIIISTKHYVGDTIHCWCPAQFTDNHEDFTNKVCWVSNTYYVPIGQKHIPEENESRRMINYYQWVPLILLTQAMLFYLPCLFWRLMNNKAGLDINNVIGTCKQLQHAGYADHYDTQIRYLVHHFDQTLRSKRDHKKHCFGKCINFIGRYTLFCGKRHGNYILVVYICTKILHLLNVIGQIIGLNYFLGTGFHAYGIEILKKIAQNKPLPSSEIFPRVTLCDFYIRTFANTQRHTVQCVLPMNLFNEKFFIFLWFWFVFIAAAMLLNVFAWLYRSLVAKNHYRYIKHHLVARNVLKQQNVDATFVKDEVSNFTRFYLRQDGMLCLRLVGINANEVASADLVKALFEFFVTNVKGYRTRKRREGRQLEDNVVEDDASSRIEEEIDP